MQGATRDLFATRLYEATLVGPDFEAFNAELAAACGMLADGDAAGRAWCRSHGYLGYTSYASLDDLTSRATIFAMLAKKLDRHAVAFSRSLGHDLGRRGRLKLDSLWVNLLPAKAVHSGHIHPLSVLSGVFYVSVPSGSGGLRLEDPRLPLMMAAPPDAGRFVVVAPVAGAIVMWESWLRHEVLAGSNRLPRISLSFNYAWR